MKIRKFVLCGLVAIQLVVPYRINPNPELDLLNISSLEVITTASYSEIQLVKTKTALRVCSTNTFKSFMDYRMITDTTSKQWSLQKQAYTQNGFRQIDKYTLVAISSMYGNVGDTLTITFEDNQVLEIIIGDIKANTDCEHPDGSMIEFIVDTETMDPGIRNSGNYNDLFKGSIKSIEKENK